MTEYHTPELEGQGSLLDLEPRPLPHAAMRLSTLEVLKTATEPVDSHWIADRIEFQESGWTAKRLGELAEEGLALRVGKYKHARTRRWRTLWKAA